MQIASRWFIVACLSALCLLPATSSAALVTGFELPDYNAGELPGQQGWVHSGGALANVLVGGEDDLPNAPEGTQFYGITQAGADTRASYQFATTAPTDLITVDVLLAYRGVTAAKQYPFVYITNGPATTNTGGVTFGFESTGENGANIVYRSGTSFESLGAAAIDTFYRFTVTIDPVDESYDIVVRQLNGTVVGSGSDAAFRNSIKTFTHIGLAANVGGTLFADQLNITVVPEPGSIILAGFATAMACVVGRRRRNRGMACK